MKPSSGHFNRTSGSKALQLQSRIDIINNINTGKKNKIPNTSSQIDHIFREKEGHLPFNDKNAKILSNLINNDKNLVLFQDYNGNSWYSKTKSDGTQIWGKVHGNKLSNGGINKTPINLDPKTGYDKNPFKKKGK
jgi:hypothetical protein